MKKATIKLTSGIILSSLFLGNVSVVDIAKAQEKEYTLESNSKNNNVSAKVIKENEKNYLAVTAATEIKNLNLNVKLADQVKKFKHKEIKAGETIKFELVLPENKNTESSDVKPAKTEATLLSGTSLARESFTTEVLVEGLKIEATVSYDVDASRAYLTQETLVSAPVQTSVIAPTVAPAVVAPVVKAAAPTQYPTVAKTQAPKVETVAKASLVEPTATPVVKSIPKVNVVEAPKPELKIVSPTKAVAGVFQVEKPVAELPKAVVTTAAPVKTTEAPKPAVTTAAPAKAVEAPKAETPVNATKFMPVESADYTITSPYGVSRNISEIGLKDVHNGVDIITNNPKESILATEAGTVMEAGVSPWGDGAQYVTIKHAPNSYTSYWHLANNSITVKAGQKVAAGQKIGTMGSTGWSTGTHLHFMHATSANIFQSHKDPMAYLKGAASKGKKATPKAQAPVKAAPAAKAQAKGAAPGPAKAPAKQTVKKTK